MHNLHDVFIFQKYLAIFVFFVAVFSQRDGCLECCIDETESEYIIEVSEGKGSTSLVLTVSYLTTIPFYGPNFLTLRIILCVDWHPHDISPLFS